MVVADADHPRLTYESTDSLCVFVLTQNALFNSIVGSLSTSCVIDAQDTQRTRVGPLEGLQDVPVASELRAAD